jgi:hypothetical protein
MLGDNGRVPFTLAHGAAALPFRRSHLIFSALLVGTFAPDFEYFLRLNPSGRFGHSLLGAFVLTLPLALLVLWLFHAFVKAPLVRLLPNAIQRRLICHLGEFHFGGPPRFALIVGSILVGIMTHLVWDSFTHPYTWLYRHWAVLSQPVQVPIIGLIPLCRALQHGSTIAGVGIFSIWLVRRYRATEPCNAGSINAMPMAQKIAFAVVVATIAAAGAFMRAVGIVGIPHDHSLVRQFVGVLLVAAIALVWWELVVYGIFSASTKDSQAEPQSTAHHGAGV